MEWLPFISVVLLLVVSSSNFLLCCYSSDSLAAGETLSDNQTIVSAGGRFEFGFFSPTNSTSNQYAGIWFAKVSVRRVVWVANRENPVRNRPAAIKISDDGNLVVLDSAADLIWSTNITSNHSINGTQLLLLDTGNLELKNGDQDSVLWQSFDFPTDSILPNMVMWSNIKTKTANGITSWKNEKDPSPGNFTLSIDPVVNYQQIVTNDSKPYVRSQVWTGNSFDAYILNNSVNPFFTTYEVDDQWANFTFQATDATSYYVLNYTGTPESFAPGKSISVSSSSGSIQTPRKRGVVRFRREEEEDSRRRRDLAERLMVAVDGDDTCESDSWTFFGSGRNALFCRSWVPAASSLHGMKGILVIIHGLNEHSGRYAHFAKQLTSSNFGVYAMDWIGHGGSDGLHGYVPSLDLVVADTAAFLEKIKSQNPGIPQFLFGHSTGGSIVLKAASYPNIQSMLEGIILTSPALRVKPAHPIIRAIAPIFSIFIPKFQFKGANKGGIPVSRDPAAMLAKYSDPLVYTGPIRVRTGYEILRMSSFLMQNIRSVTVPFLVLHGTSDRVTDPWLHKISTTKPHLGIRT